MIFFAALIDLIICIEKGMPKALGLDAGLFIQNFLLAAEKLELLVLKRLLLNISM